jgi:hypothetical protein
VIKLAQVRDQWRKTGSERLGYIKGDEFLMIQVFDDVTLCVDDFPTFRRTVLLSSSRVKQSKKKIFTSSSNYYQFLKTHRTVLTAL